MNEIDSVPSPEEDFAKCTPANGLEDVELLNGGRQRPRPGEVFGLLLLPGPTVSRRDVMHRGGGGGGDGSHLKVLRNVADKRKWKRKQDLDRAQSSHVKLRPQTETFH